MTLETTMTTVLSRVPNRFLLTVAVAKRARQLAEGAKPLIEVGDPRPSVVLIALKEIEMGLLDVFINKSAQNDTALLDELNQYLDIDLAQNDDVDEVDDKPKKEVKAKGKSKSLAA